MPEDEIKENKEKKAKPFLIRLQELPEEKKRIILWSVVIILALVLFIGWIKSLQQRLRAFPREEFIEGFRAPLLERMQDMPQIDLPETRFQDMEIPEITEEERQRLKEQLTEEELEEFEKWLKKLQETKNFEQ